MKYTFIDLFLYSSFLSLSPVSPEHRRSEKKKIRFFFSFYKLSWALHSFYITHGYATGFGGYVETFSFEENCLLKLFPCFAPPGVGSVDTFQKSAAHINSGANGANLQRTKPPTLLRQLLSAGNCFQRERPWLRTAAPRWIKAVASALGKGPGWSRAIQQINFS